MEGFMPQSLAAEISLLGSIFLDDRVLDEISYHTKVEFFYRAEYQIIYQAMLDMYSANIPIDLVTLIEWLKDRKTLEAAGGVDRIVNLPESVPSAANASYYARIIRDKALLRQVVQMGRDLEHDALDGCANVSEYVEEVEKMAHCLSEQMVPDTHSAISDVAAGVVEEMLAVDKTEYRIPTGFHEYDERFGGLKAGEVMLIAGRPSMGKTALGLGMAYYAAAQTRYPVAIFSMEMTKANLVERLVCSECQIDSRSVWSGYINEVQKGQLRFAAGIIGRAAMILDSDTFLTPMKLRAKARRFFKAGTRLIMVDYIQLMSAPGYTNRWQEVGEISRNIKLVATELNIPIIAVSQLNRMAEGRSDHRPRMSDLRESGNLEQDADVVLLLHREDYYHKEDAYLPTNIAEVEIAKNRNGPTGKFDLVWRGNLAKFENKAKNPYDYDE